jgi:hypothetical protein
VQEDITTNLSKSNKANKINKKSSNGEQNKNNLNNEITNINTFANDEEGVNNASINVSTNGRRMREKKLKFTYQENKDWETIDEEIAQLESDIEEIDVKIRKAVSDYGKLNQLMREKQEKETLLEEKMERWLYLSELQEKIIASQQG